MKEKTGNKITITTKNSEKEKNIKKFQQRMNKPGNLFEYFAIIGINPKMASNNCLYELSQKLEFKPELITKYPPINKSYINLDEDICELVFPQNIKIEKFNNKPEPEIFRYLLGNSYYSVEYPLKYLTCLKFYESLEQYQELQTKILKQKKNISFDLNINDNNNNYSTEFFHENKNSTRNKSQKIKNLKKNNFNTNPNSNNNLSQYYIPKIICFISIKPCYKLHEKILYQLYNYISLKKIKIPIEKIVLNILCNIPIPPRGIHIYQYHMVNDSEEFKKINIQSEQMNKIKNLDKEIKIIFNFFNIDKFLVIFKYILFETKTILFSSNVNNLCNFIHGMISILYPFSYPFQISSCLKEDAYEILESISPYILGINKKFEKNFFEKNKLEIKGANFLIIDLDNKKSLVNSIENSPNFPKNILKKIKSKLEIGLNNINNDKNTTEEKDEENTLSFAFYDFFLNILINYADFLNKDNLKKNFKIKNLQILFKTKEFIESHSSSEKPFYKALTETQMFNDFIFKKMIPKDITDKLDILLFDENINKKNNKKIFSKNKSTSFLSSKEYDFKSVHKIPKVKALTEEELNKFKNRNYYKKNLIKGTNIFFQKNDYFLNYMLFPKFNLDFYNFPSNEFFLYFYTMENITNDINRVNTDLLAKSLINNYDNDSFLNEGEGMLDYIYLTYIEVWGYSFWYQDLSERDYRFEQLMAVLDKIKRQEIELFNILFEMLDKFHEKEKIRKLYYKILEYKLSPNSFIYSIVGKNIKNDQGNIINNFYLGKKEEKNNFQRRAFKSENETCILGDNIHFIYFQECPECTKNIDIKMISKDYKKMKKELLWAQCPLCFNYIKPQISVILGNEIFPGGNFSLTKKEFFTLYSPYELKNNIKYIIDKEQFHLLNIDKLRNIYPNIFWNCIWYFQLYELDYSIILPYEVNIYKKKSSSNAIITPFIITKICPYPRKNNAIIEEKEHNDDDNNINNQNEIVINDNSKINKDKSIIHNNISFELRKENNIFRKKLSMSEVLDSLQSKKINELNLNLNLTNHSSMDNFKTPNKSKNKDIEDDETNKIKLNISKTTSK